MVPFVASTAASLTLTFTLAVHQIRPEAELTSEVASFQRYVTGAICFSIVLLSVGDADTAVDDKTQGYAHLGVESPVACSQGMVTAPFVWVLSSEFARFHVRPGSSEMINNEAQGLLHFGIF